MSSSDAPSPRWAGFAPVAVVGLVLLMLTACGGQAQAQPPAATATPVVAAATPDAQGLSGGSITPRPETAKKDSGDVYSRGCSSGYGDSAVHPCVFDFGIGADAPVVVAAGDSKMAQWVPALQEIAQQQHWKLISLTKSGCAFSDIHRRWKKKEYTSCVTWNRAAVTRVLRLKPDLLITTELDFYPTMRDGKVLKGAANRAEMVRGLSARISRMRRVGIPVATLAETPRMGFNTANCVRDHRDDLAACARPRAEVLGKAGVVRDASKRSKATFIDLTRFFCTAKTCPSVRGNLLVYRDKHHLTATYARSLAPWLTKGLTNGLSTALRARLFTS